MNDRDDIDEVLATLRTLLGKASSPVVRGCLEEAHDDIAHLASKDVPPVGTANQAGAA